MTNAKKAVGILALALILAAIAAWVVAITQPDIYHTKERRVAKDAMITAIKGDLAAGKSPSRPADSEWMNSQVIFCEDGSWLAYRSQCHKQDPKVYDIFIAKASDGKWYYSTYHFCIDAIVLQGFGQSPSLEAFKKNFLLMEFDGSSDLALNQTWPPPKP